jgi:hypothetical protein
VGDFYSVFLFKKVSECQIEVQLNEWRTCLTHLTMFYSD